MKFPTGDKDKISNPTTETVGGPIVAPDRRLGQAPHLPYPPSVTQTTDKAGKDP